jgi:hypothetical protein
MHVFWISFLTLFFTKEKLHNDEDYIEIIRRALDNSASKFKQSYSIGLCLQ